MQQEETTRQQTEPLEVDIEEHVDASPDEVFEYLADGEHFPAGDDVRIGDVVVSDRPHHIQWRVEFEGEVGAYPGTVDVTLAPDGSGTLVHVVHRTSAFPRACVASRMLALAA